MMQPMRELPHKFEAGTVNAAWSMLHWQQAIRYLQKTGYDPM